MFINLNTESCFGNYGIIVDNLNRHIYGQIVVLPNPLIGNKQHLSKFLLR